MASRSATPGDDQGVHIGPADRLPHGGSESLRADSDTQVGRGIIGHLQFGVQTEVHRKDAKSLGVTDNPHPVAGRDRLRGQQLGDVERVGQPGGSDHPGLLKEGADNSFVQLVVGEARRGRTCRPDFTAITGLGLAEHPSQPGELPWIAEQLEENSSSTTSVRVLPCQNCSRRFRTSADHRPHERRQAQAAAVA